MHFVIWLQHSLLFHVLSSLFTVTHKTRSRFPHLFKTWTHLPLCLQLLPILSVSSVSLWTTHLTTWPLNSFLTSSGSMNFIFTPPTLTSVLDFRDHSLCLIKTALQEKEQFQISYLQSPFPILPALSFIYHGYSDLIDLKSLDPLSFPIAAPVCMPISLQPNPHIYCLLAPIPNSPNSPELQVHTIHLKAKKSNPESLKAFSWDAG